VLFRSWSKDKVYLIDTRFKHHCSIIGIVGKILEMKLVAGFELRVAGCELQGGQWAKRRTYGVKA
jgi:hypothetical protein